MLSVRTSSVFDGSSSENDENLVTIDSVRRGKHDFSTSESVTDVASGRRNPTLLEVGEVSADFSVVTSDL